MVKSKILFYINIILKAIILMLILPSAITQLNSEYFFNEIGIFLILFTPSIPLGIWNIIIIFGLILSYFIIFCVITKEYQKCKRYYIVNFIGEAILTYIFFNQVILGLMYIFFINKTALDPVFYYFILYWLLFLIISIITSIIGRKYFSIRTSELQGIKPRPDTLEKLRDILNVSNRIKLERVQNILDLNNKDFDEKIIKWANEFGFRIDGEYLIVNKESIAEFIEALDEKFIEWETSEKDNIGKL